MNKLSKKELSERLAEVDKRIDNLLESLDNNIREVETLLDRLENPPPNTTIKSYTMNFSRMYKLNTRQKKLNDKREKLNKH